MEVEDGQDESPFPEGNETHDRTSSSPSTSKSGLPLTVLRTQLLNHIGDSKEAHFVSQQIGEPELPFQKKRDIAEELLDRSPAQFLGRFGHHLEERHLDYFKGDYDLLKAEAYEIDFHLKELGRFFCKTTHMVDVKNRRYDALKKMVAGGDPYFSEDEMRQRNPYLYEQLVGVFLSDEERKERETPDLDNITFVNLLMTQISRDETKKLRNEQEIAENGIPSDETSSEEDDEDEEERIRQRGGGTWGETAEDVTKLMAKRKKNRQRGSERKQQRDLDPEDITDEEKILMMREFVTTMYNSFIDGKDTEFDYSKVDCNPDFDCVDIREKDEEEKYFDADNHDDEVDAADSLGEAMKECNEEDGRQSPPPPPKKEDDTEEDALDLFMKTVKTSSPTSDITNSFQNLCRQGKNLPAEKSRVVKRPAIKFNIGKMGSE